MNWSTAEIRRIAKRAGVPMDERLVDHLVWRGIDMDKSRKSLVMGLDLFPEHAIRLLNVQKEQRDAGQRP